MSNRKVILYIAASLDGYIATENNALSFLSVVRMPGEDYGYNAFVNTVDTVIMGRKTYDIVQAFPGDFPHKGRKCYVLSKTKTGTDENASFYNGAVTELILELKKEDGKNIFVDGGAEVVFEMMKHNLFDEYIISIIPYLLGNGISLFKPGRQEKELKLKDSKVFASGLVQLHYEPVAV